MTARTPADFRAAIARDPDLAFAGISDRDEIVILHEPSGLTTGISPETALGAPWDQLREVLCHEREGMMHRYITRIVGYYSYLRNWNKSKLSELADRHKGDYGVEEVE